MISLKLSMYNVQCIHLYLENINKIDVLDFEKQRLCAAGIEFSNVILVRLKFTTLCKTVTVQKVFVRLS